MDPHMVNHNSRRCNWEESFHKSKYGGWDPGPHRNHVHGGVQVGQAQGARAESWTVPGRDIAVGGLAGFTTIWIKTIVWSRKKPLAH